MILIMKKSSAPQVLGAVDLGSNSFHLIVARVSGRRIVVLDRMREMLRFGSGLDWRGRITREAEARALACLKRFGDRLADYNPAYVRAVGTNTLRRAQDGHAFLQQAERNLGSPVEIISGIEEARLIYRGVCAYLRNTRERLNVLYGEKCRFSVLNSLRVRLRGERGCVCTCSLMM